MTAKETVLGILGKDRKLTPVDPGQFSKMSKSGMTFNISAYDTADKNGGSYRVSFIDMKAMLGLMKMETVIITSDDRDVPLFSFDVIKAMGKNTVLAEGYDTLVGDAPAELLEEGRKIKASYESLPDYAREARWYDAILLYFSLAKTGKEVKDKVEGIVSDYTGLFRQWLAAAPEVSPEEKKAATGEYVSRLLSEGGASTDQFKKLFGEEKTDGLFRFLFNV